MPCVRSELGKTILVRVGRIKEQDPILELTESPLSPLIRFHIIFQIIMTNSSSQLISSVMDSSTPLYLSYLPIHIIRT